MATYAFPSAAADDDTLTGFDPEADTITFAASYSASGLLLRGVEGGTELAYGDESVLLADVEPAAIDGSQLSFDNGSMYRAGTFLDEAFTGSPVGDQFEVSSGGNDSITAGAGNDVIRIGSALGFGDAINGGDGSADELRVWGDQTVGIDAGWVTGVERIVVDSGGLVTLFLHDTMFSSTPHAVVVDATGRDATGTLHVSGESVTHAFSILGGAGEDTLVGGAAGDTLDGGENDDDLNGMGGNDSLRGGAGFDVVHGGAGNDTLVGGSGTDVLFGDDGNDLYHLTLPGHLADESDSTGVDRVWSFISDYTLGTGMEHGDIKAASARLVGNTLANELRGGTGNDTLEGGAGNDTLAGLDGNDSLLGGEGNDTYHVAGSGDRVVEAASGGTDLVITSVDYAATQAYVEYLTAVGGTGSIDLTGNQLANILTGNDGRNILNGAAGADVLRGGKGNDTYYLDNAKDNIDGESSFSSGGIDLVVTGVDYAATKDYVENLTAATGTSSIDLTGNQLANVITGNAGKNILHGAAGSDMLKGGAAADQLTGGSGADRFVYAAASESTKSALDRITDFTRGSDKVDLSHLDGNGGKSGHQDFAFIGSRAFSANATGQLRFAAESGKVMLYGSTDADATAEFAVQVAGATTLSASDFVF